jgi:stage V sporulation protein G
MYLSDIRINLCPASHGRLKAFCALTFDNTFVIRDVKVIEGDDGIFLAMPSRKLADRCRRCSEKNHLKARYCNNCGMRLDENRYRNYVNGNLARSVGQPRLKLHADIAHPINAHMRQRIETQVIQAYRDEVDRSKLPGYVPPAMVDGDFDLDFALPVHEAADRLSAASPPSVTLRPTGTTH